MAPRRLGLFGGSFDPPHIGHLVVAQDVVEALDLDRLLFIPAGNPPHKLDRSLAPAPLRLEMVQCLVAGDDRFGVSEVELSRSGPSYTVDTLRHYRDLHDEAELFFVMGADQAETFGSWREPETVKELATLVVMAREGMDPPSGDFVTAPVTRLDISSSAIRSRIRDGRPIRYLVPEIVRRIIESNRLYRAVP
ncbi:MAG: nicotinate-nucleotide adenylyltransferase [Gemmatimonadota bacterium]